MRALAFLVLLLAMSPLAMAEPDVRPLCDGEPIVDIEGCGDGVRVHTCGSDDRLMGAGCFAL